MLTALFIFEIVTFLSCFGYVEKQLDNEAKVNFKLFHVTDCTTNNCDAHTVSRSKHNQTMKFDQLIKYTRNIFLQKLYTKCAGDTTPRP